MSKGRSEIVNVGRLRIKECDRLSAITKELNKLGAKVTEKEDSIIVDGVENLLEVLKFGATKTTE